MKSTIAALAALATLASPAWAFSTTAPQRNVGPARAGAELRGSCSLQMAGKHRNGNPNGVMVNRRVALVLAAVPALGLRKVSAAPMTEAEEVAKLQAEAARIQEIFDIQKELNSDLPSLKSSPKAGKSPATPEPQVAAKAAPAADKDAVDAKNLVAVIDKMMKSLEEEGEGGMRTVLAYSTPNNPIKNMPFTNVINAMRDSSYALLFGKFVAYEIKKPEEPQMIEDERRASVDVVVKAPYTVMLQNGVQFNEMVMPKSGDEKKICSVTFRWNMRQESDGTWESDGCYIVA